VVITRSGEWSSAPVDGRVRLKPDATSPQYESSAPTVSLVADGPPGTVPDLHGMSAREAVRTLVKLGMHARVSGDGFVVSQDPPAGAPLEPGTVCRLVLERKPQP
jgi:beta-lactam-binding protein with PASTA domain